MAVKEHWNFTDEASVPAELSEIEGGSGAVSINSGHLRIDTGGTGTGDYAAAAYSTALESDKLTIIYGEVKMSGATGAWVPNIIGLFDSSGTPAAMSASNRDSALRMWQEYQMSSAADNHDRIQLRFKNPSGTMYQYVASTNAWTSTFTYTRAYYDEGSLYRFAIIYDGTQSPPRARSCVWGYTESVTGWGLNYDSTWVDFDTGSTDIDPFDNDIYVVFGDPTNDESKSAQTTFDFRRIMIGEIDESNLNEFAWTNKGAGNFPVDYEIFKYLNPMPEAQTQWVPREQDGYFPGGPDTDTPEFALGGGDDWNKDPFVFYDGTTYWMFYNKRVTSTSKCHIYVRSTTDILNGTWGSETLVSSPDTGEDYHEFPWVTKYGGTWYLFYGVQQDPLDWEIQYKTTTQTNPTSGWSSATTVLTAGAGGDFDDGGVSLPSLIWHSGSFTGGTWYMLYGGYDGVGDWEGGIAKSTTGITGTYTRVDTDPTFAKETFSTQLDGDVTDSPTIVVDSTTGLSAGDFIYIDKAYTPTEVLSVDSGTQFTATIEMTVSDGGYVRSYSYNSFASRFAQRINSYWVVYGTSFKFSGGDEAVSIYVATTTDLAIEDCTFREMRVGDTALDLVIPPIALTELSNENLGTAWEAMSSAAGPTYTLTAAYGSFTQSGQASNTLFNRLIGAAQGSFVLTGEATALLLGRLLAAGQGSFTLTGEDAGLLFDRVLGAAQGSFTLSGQDAGLLFDRILGASQGSFALTGQDAGLLLNRLLSADQGSFTLTGQETALLLGRLLSASQGSFALTGQDVALAYGLILAAEMGSFTLTGQDVGLLYGRILTASQGSFTLSGQTTGLLFNRLLSASQGSFTLGGQDAGLLFGRLLSAASGSFTLTGIAADLIYSGAGAPDYLLTASQGSFSLTGEDSALLLSRLLAATQGSFTLTGQATDLLQGRRLSAGQGAFVLTGQDATLLLNRVLSAGQGSFTLTGVAVALTFSGEVVGAVVELQDSETYLVVLTDSGAYVVVLQDALP